MLIIKKLLLHLGIELEFIEDREDKTRIKCPSCFSFLLEIKPILLKGQEIVTNCKRCRMKVEIKR